jgi:hypothetical protein
MTRSKKEPIKDMATTKKTTKKPAAKKTTKAAPARSVSKTTVKRVTNPAKTAEMRSFAPARPVEPFFTFRISHQTLYWLVLAGIVLGLGIWVVNINDKVQRIYDQIDQTNSTINALPDPNTVKPKAQQ